MVPMKTNEHDGGAAFEALVGQLNYPMFIVTTTSGGRQGGCLVGFASQVSIQPRRFLVGLSNKNHTYRLAEQAEHLAVHVLAARERDLARLFGEQTGDVTDKSAQCAWHPGPADLPILDDAAAWFSGRIVERLPLGDHVAFLLEPEAGRAAADTGALITFGDVSGLDPGHQA